MKSPNETERRTIATIVAVVLGMPACSTVLGFEAPSDATPCSCELIPDGWRGPLRFEESSGDLAACAGDFPTLDYDGDADPVGAPAICSCACGEPTGVTCGAAEARLFTDAACAATCAGATSSVSTCAKLSSSTSACSLSAVNGVRVTIPASGGSCAPSTASQQVPRASWGQHVRLCAGAVETACGASCDVAVCVARAGESACPTGFPVAHVAYASMVDSRMCTACTCGVPTGSTCSGTVGVYSNASCSTQTAGGAADGSCVAVSSTNRVMATTGTASGGSCATAGGTPTGAVTAQDPTTICCTR